MSDLVKRLRSVRGNFIIPVESPPIFAWAEEAADEIERLRAGKEKALRHLGEAEDERREACDEIERLRSEHRAAFDAGWKGGYWAGRNRDGDVEKEQKYKDWSEAALKQEDGDE